MKKSDFKFMIRKIVREEVAMAIQEVITELKQPTRQVSRPKPKKKMVEKKSYTSNSILNDVLNETANDEWQTMGGGTYTSNKMNDVLKGQYGDLMNGNNINDRPVTNVPDHLMNAFTKDYSKTLKAMEKKAMKSRGV